MMRILSAPKSKGFSKIFLAMCAGLTLASCSAPSKGLEPGTLRVNLGAEPPGLDWDVATDSTSFDVVSNLMVGLTEYTPQLTCKPACAASWDVLDGGKRYRFHLRRDVRWTDRKPVRAKDFEYAWQRLLDPQTGASYAYLFYDVLNAYEFNTGKIKDAGSVGVKAVDDYTFEVRLRKPIAYFIYLTAICPSYPMRRDVIEKWGDRWTEPDNIVTNGPFQLKKWAHEYKIELASNPLYFDGEPKVKRIKMFMVSESSTAFALYENDQLDFVDNRSFSTSDVERFKDSPQYKNVPLLRQNYVGFNVHKKPFDDARVRKAFSMALDRDTFATILRRHERGAYTWIPPGMEGYSKDSAVKFDPVQAKKYLAEAGFPAGENFPAIFMLYPNREDIRLVCEQLQDQWKRNLGITIHLQNEEWKVYLEHLHRDPPPLFRATWGADYPDPETFMNLFMTKSGNNYPKFKNAKYDELVERASSAQNETERGKLYQQADKMLCVEETPIAPLFLATQNAMVKPWVHGLEFNACDIQFFKNVEIKNASP